MKRDSSHIKKVINQKRIISFDIFDTLIERDTKHPEDIFKIVQEEYNSTSKKKVSGYRNIRIQAERKARKECRREEITLDEIYANMDDVPREIGECLRTLEVQAEIEHCQRKQQGWEFYQYARRMGKKIILVSDMYLERGTIEQILDKNGYKGYMELFVSSQYGLKKRTAHLFSVVMRSLKCNAGQILHIGDNPVSDGLSARKAGIASLIL